MFDLLVLGYVEETVSGVSFRFLEGLNWKICIEVRVDLIFRYAVVY